MFYQVIAKVLNFTFFNFFMTLSFRSKVATYAPLRNLISRKFNVIKYCIQDFSGLLK